MWENDEARNSKAGTTSLFGIRALSLFRHSSFVIRHVVMAYLDQFLSVIVKHGGSDLHIGVGEPPKMRMHGDLSPIREDTVAHGEATGWRNGISGWHTWRILSPCWLP